MSIEAIGSGLKTILAGIEGLRVYSPSEIPDSPDLPCALILPGETDYNSDFSANYDINFRILILVTKQDSPSAFNKIYDYIEPTGDSSVLAKVQADRTLGATCDSCKVSKNLGIGSANWGGITYLSTEFEIQIYA
jgi:hypothetical protein